MLQDIGMFLVLSMLVYGSWWHVMVPLSVACILIATQIRSPLVTVWLLAVTCIAATWLGVKFPPEADPTEVGYIGMMLPLVVPIYVLVSYTIGALIDYYVRGTRFRLRFERV